MSRYSHGLRSIAGISPHVVLVGLALETDDHAAGVLCGRTAVSEDELVLDDAVVYETGQAAGQLSAARAQRLAAGLLGVGPDLQAVIAYVQIAPGSATLAQTQAALQAFMRIVQKLVS